MHRRSQVAEVNSSCLGAKTSCILVRLPAYHSARKTSKRHTSSLRRVAHYLICTHIAGSWAPIQTPQWKASSWGIEPASVLLYDYSVDPQLISKNTIVFSIAISEDCNHHRTFKETPNVGITHLLSLLWSLCHDDVGQSFKRRQCQPHLSLCEVSQG